MTFKGSIQMSEASKPPRAKQGAVAAALAAGGGPIHGWEGIWRGGLDPGEVRTLMINYLILLQVVIMGVACTSDLPACETACMLGGRGAGGLKSLLSCRRSPSGL